MAADPPAELEARSSGAEGDPVTPYDRLVWSGDEAEALLASGERRAELVAYFGAKEYRELAELARAARAAAPRPGVRRTLIVPGTLGSLLGLPRAEPLPRDILWLDPIDIGGGRLTELALHRSASVRAYGVLLYGHLGLRLRLRAAGLDADFYPYDWRLGVDTLGRELARRLREEPSSSVSLVAHSLGGLVARAALACEGGEKVERVVLLGTPNRGSFAALQALRGSYWAVRKIAQLDRIHSSETLASEVFTTFPSLYHMLPGTTGPPDADGREEPIDLTDPAAWPDSGPQPHADLLASARAVQGLLAPPDERCASIVGVGQPTVTSAWRRDGEFVYRVTRLGDGSVPAASARLGSRSFHAAVGHGDLTRDPAVAAAIVDLLTAGQTHRLPRRWRSRSLAERTTGDRELSGTLTAKVDWTSLTSEERRVFLEYLNEPPRLPLRVPDERGPREPAP